MSHLFLLAAVAPLRREPDRLTAPLDANAPDDPTRGRRLDWPTLMKPLPPLRREPDRLTAPLDADAPDDPARPRRLDWATLTKRAYALDVLVCPKCDGSMVIIGIVDG